MELGTRVHHIGLGVFLIFFCSYQGKCCPSPMLETFVSTLLGDFSNVEQYRREQANNVSAGDKHLWLQLRYLQAEVPALDPAVSLYYEQYVNNASAPSRQQILAFRQTTNTQIRMASYNIVNASRFSSSPESVAQLKHLTLSELTNRPECDALWEQQSSNFFTSSLRTPDQCTFMFRGQLVRPDGSRNLTCQGISLAEVFVTVDGSKIVSGTYEPYQLLRVQGL